MSKFLSPPDSEPMRKNRFLVVFPDVLEIQPIFVRSITLPKVEVISVAEPVFFGKINFRERIEVTDCLLKLIPTCDKDLLKNLLDIQKQSKNFDFRVQMLDPTGMVVEEYKMISSVLKEISVETLDYKNDESLYYNVRLAVSHFIIE
jgi:hypothetical protein